MRVRSATFLLAIVALAGSTAPVYARTQPASATLLRYHFTMGQKSLYNLGLGLSGAIPVLAPKLQLSEQVPFTQLVTVKYPDGSAQLSYSFTSATTSLNGQTTTSTLSASSVDRISATGKVTHIKSLGLSGQMGGVMNVDPTVGLPQFPLSAMPVGGTWKATQTISLGSFGVLSGPLKYTLAGLATGSDKHTIATINATGVLPLTLASATLQATGNATGTEVIKFDVTSGSVVSATAHLKLAANLGARGSDQSSGSVTQPVNLDLRLNLTHQVGSALAQ